MQYLFWLKLPFPCKLKSPKCSCRGGYRGLKSQMEWWMVFGRRIGFVVGRVTQRHQSCYQTAKWQPGLNLKSPYSAFPQFSSCLITLYVHFWKLPWEGFCPNIENFLKMDLQPALLDMNFYFYPPGHFATWPIHVPNGWKACCRGDKCWDDYTELTRSQRESR